MTKTLADLFDSFTSSDATQQLAKIRSIRTERSIERPAVAKRQQKKAVKRSRTALQKAEKLIDNLSDDSVREALIARLKKELE